MPEVDSSADSSSAGSTAVALPPPAGTLDKKKTAIGAIVTVIVLIIVFAGIIPKFGSYSLAIESIKTMSAAWLCLLIASVVVMIFVFVLPYQAAIPHLKYWPAFVIRQTAFTISNAVPAGERLVLRCSTQCSTRTASRVQWRQAVLQSPACGASSSRLSCRFSVYSRR